MKRWLLFGCLLMLGLSAHASLEVSALQSEPILMAKHSETLEDPSRRLTIHDIKDDSKGWEFRNQIAKSSVLDFGYSQSAWWIKLTLRNEGKLPVKRVLQITNSHLAQVSF